jgi:hypothetical protein
MTPPADQPPMRDHLTADFHRPVFRSIVDQNPMVENFPMMGQPPGKKIFLVEEMTNNGSQDDFSDICRSEESCIRFFRCPEVRPIRMHRNAELFGRRRLDVIHGVDMWKLPATSELVRR